VKMCRHVWWVQNYLWTFRRFCSQNAVPKNGSLDQVMIGGAAYKKDSMSNVGVNVANKVGRNLHLQTNHPIEILKRRIISHFHSAYRSRFGGCVFASLDNLSPIVTAEQNFDSLLVPKDHISRSKNDNYYVNSNYVLRSHTSAHQRDLLQSGWNAFLVTGDVYRRDEIDRTHYPVFHQMEGVRVFDTYDLFADHKTSSDLSIFEHKATERTPEKQEWHTADASRFVEFNLKYTLMGLAEFLFGSDIETRWVDTYFPFTHPSWELEIKIGGEWVEMLGCGIMEHGILQKAGASSHIGWAFGLGLERFAMKLFDVPDIRLFWSEDPRFLSQFQLNEDAKFKPFSKYPPSFKDISFWVNQPDFSPNDLFEVCRAVAGDWIEEMVLTDDFQHPKTGKTSHCYRITYRAMDKTLTDEEVNTAQDRIREEVQKQLDVELR